MAQDFRHIVRVAGTDLDGSLTLEYALAQIKGLGISLSKVIVEKSDLDRDLRTGNLADADIQKLEDIMKNPKKYAIPDWMLNRRKDRETGEDRHLLGPDLTLAVKSDVDTMMKLKSWKGVRHSLGLKVRGQRTKTTGRSGRAVGVRRRRAPRV